MILFFLSIPVSQISTRTNHIGLSSDNPTATIETRYVWTGFWKVTGKPRDLDSTPLVCQAGNGLDDDGRDAAGGEGGEAGEEDEGGADDAHRGVPSYQLLTWLEAETLYISILDPLLTTPQNLCHSTGLVTSMKFVLLALVRMEVHKEEDTATLY